MNCGDCKYSHDTGTALLCWGQRFAPPVDVGDWCEGWRPKSVVPKTNYDILISKTPEELAEIMVSDCPPNYPHGECREYEKNDGNLDCSKCWLDWLKSPADKEG